MTLMPVHQLMHCPVAFDHVTSWLRDLREFADDNVTIIRELACFMTR